MEVLTIVLLKILAFLLKYWFFQWKSSIFPIFEAPSANNCLKKYNWSTIEATRTLWLWRVFYILLYEWHKFFGFPTLIVSGGQRKSSLPFIEKPTHLRNSSLLFDFMLCERCYLPTNLLMRYMIHIKELFTDNTQIPTCIRKILYHWIVWKTLNCRKKMVYIHTINLIAFQYEFSDFYHF